MRYATHDQRFVDQKFDAIMAYLSARPQLTRVPYHVDQQIEFAQEVERAIQCRPDPEITAAVEQAKQRIAADVESMARRREFEDRVAVMIARDVHPLTQDKKVRELAGKLMGCRRRGYVALTPQGDAVFRWEHKCNLGKICPDEARTESKRLATRYLQPMLEYLRDNKRAQFQYWVISPPHCGLGELADYQKRVYRFFSELRRRKEFKGKLLGALVTLENPLAKSGDQWNVHLNVMAITDGVFPWREYRAAWAREFGGCSTSMQGQREIMKAAAARADGPVTMAEAVAGRFVELCKYTTKINGGKTLDELAAGGADIDPTGGFIEAPAMFQWSGAAFLEWFEAVRKFRRTRSYGCLFRINAPDDEQPETETIGTIQLDEHGARYRYDVRLFLIPADNSTSQDHAARHFDSYAAPPGFP